MNLRLLTANDIFKIKDYIDSSKFEDVYYNKSLLASINQDAATIRNLIFQGIFICVGNMENDKIKQLLILEKPKTMVKEIYSLNVPLASLDYNFIKSAFGLISSIYDLDSINKLKIIAIVDNEIEKIQDKLGEVFNLEINFSVDHFEYFEYGYKVL
ncbi:hypothetical protein [Thomasclavelia spiroformis]|uniref:hypothetical protein n=1 Tax=Thomasclavelia spiroformis TaxID=29348 RepID=UPI0039A047CE